MISDFISKRGRKFSAKLVMENDGGGFRFEFPARAPKKKKTDEEEATSSESKASSATEVAEQAKPKKKTHEKKQSNLKKP